MPSTPPCGHGSPQAKGITAPSKSVPRTAGGLSLVTSRKKISRGARASHAVRGRAVARSAKVRLDDRPESRAGRLLVSSSSSGAAGEIHRRLFRIEVGGNASAVAGRPHSAALHRAAAARALAKRWIAQLPHGLVQALVCGIKAIPRAKAANSASFFMDFALCRTGKAYPKGGEARSRFG
jgi:hypothetical protein